MSSWTMRRDEEAGFTLIELMVVVMIIGILIAIALPSFLGARSRAQDKQAQSSLRNALADAKVCFTDEESYLPPAPAQPCNAAKLSALNTPLQYVDAGTASTDPNVVSVNPASANVMYLTSWSKSGSCFAMKEDARAGVRFGIPAVTMANCAAGNATVTGGTAYNSSW